MSIGLVIANITGSLRPAAALTGSVLSTTGSVTAAGSQNTHANPLPGLSQLTPGFSVVVLQLMNEEGTVTATIPSAQQLAAYRNGTVTPTL